jgi:hypothetical protein
MTQRDQSNVRPVRVQEAVWHLEAATIKLVEIGDYLGMQAELRRFAESLRRELR